MFSTFACGKLLITGEYAVLDGALALAVPVRYGQTLVVKPGENSGIIKWSSFDKDENSWFTAAFDTATWTITDTSDRTIAERLLRILQRCAVPQTSLNITITADFPLNWGLGSSSTLIAALARWAGVNPYQLLAATFGGSGYDIACAYANGPLLYQLDPHLPAGEREIVTDVVFDPPFKDELYFIYLGKKQDSREGIQRYRKKVADKNTTLISNISDLTRAVLQANQLPDFEKILLAHENLLADALELPRAQDLHFPEFPGVIKSLGAWGGDFVLATLPGNDEKILAGLRAQGYLVIKYTDMV